MSEIRGWRGCVAVAAAVASGTIADAALAGTVRPGRTLAPRHGQQVQVTAETMHGIEFPTTVRTLIAKAQPDSCFVAPNDPGNTNTLPCLAGAQPKVNQAYTWSIVTAGNDVWWGTVANPLCGVFGAFLGLTTPIETPSYVCEFPGGNPLGDTRPPQIWLYQSVGGAVTNKTPVSALIPTTAGIRAAGFDDNVVLMAGPRLSLGGGLNMFAFDATTRTFLSAATVQAAPTLPQPADFVVYTDIRTFLVVEGELYAGVKYELRDAITGAAKARGGKVLRWTGNSGAPFTFVEVGDLDTEAAYLAYHEGRIFVSTWPVRDPLSADPFPDNTVLAGVWMSPDLGGDDLLDAADAPNWTKVWQADDFEPDPLMAATYAGGAIASFDGYLYWGTMHVPFVATMLHLQAYGAYYGTLDSTTTPTAAQAFLEALIGTYRTATIFRGSSFATTPQFDLVYGNPFLPTATFTPGSPATLSWNLTESNLMGGTPGIEGLAGFGNPFNNYLWSAQVHGGRLWMGTMDWSYLIWDGFQALLAALAAENITIDLSQLPQIVQDFIACQAQATDTATVTGADLYYFPGSDRPAFPESISGVGNFSSYGVRSMASAPTGLFLGMANPMNLLTDTADDLPEGGWEVIRLVNRPTNTAVGNGVTATLDDGTRVTFCGVAEAGYTVGAWIPTPCCGLFLPIPEGYQTPTQVLLLGSSALISTTDPCTGPYPLSVCVPYSQVGVARLYQPLVVPGPGGPEFLWQDITTGYANGQVCGEVQEGAQELLNLLGYDGYLGVVVLLEQDPPIPALTWGGLAVLAGLIALAGIALARGSGRAV